jgi:hypothetical protein
MTGGGGVVVVVFGGVWVDCSCDSCLCRAAVHPGPCLVCYSYSDSSFVLIECGQTGVASTGKTLPAGLLQLMSYL